MLVQLNETAWCIASEIVAIQAETTFPGRGPFVRVVTRMPAPRGAFGLDFGEAPRIEERVFVLDCESPEAATALSRRVAEATGWHPSEIAEKV